MAKRFINRKSNNFNFKSKNNKNDRAKSLFATRRPGLPPKTAKSEFFLAFATGKSATVCLDSSGISTASLIGFGNCSDEYTQILNIKNENQLASLKNHFCFTVPTNFRLNKIIVNFSAYEVDIDDDTELFPCLYIAKSSGLSLPFKLLESTKTQSEVPLKRSTSCLQPQELFAVSDNVNASFDFADRIAICLMLKAKGKVLDRVGVSLFCNGSLLFQ